jgi:sugar lactone lactonase YvrE
MRGLMSVFRRTDEARQVGQYWDEVVRRAPATPMPRSDVAVAAGETIRHIHGLEDRANRSAPFADRQLAMLLARQQEMNMMDALSIPAARGASIPNESEFARALERVRIGRSQHGWAPALSAAAIVAITISIVTVLAVFVWPNRSQPDRPAIFAPSSPTVRAIPSPSAASATLVWTYTGEGKTTLEHPASATIAPDGALWVVDTTKGRIEIVKPDGSLEHSWESAGNGDGQFYFGPLTSGAGQVAFGPDGGFYVAEATNARIQHFDKYRVFVSSWSGATTPNRTFGLLVGVAVDPDGNVWAVDEQQQGVRKFSPEGKYLMSVGEYGHGPGQFEAPGTLAFDAQKHLLVPDGKGNIQVFGLDGTFVEQIPLVDATGKAIHAGYGVTTDASGRMYVPDPESKSVYVYDPNGTLLLTWSGDGSHALNDPWNVVVDGDGNMYVVDHGASAVYKVHIDFSS